jgi:hypothetical protein
VVSTTKLSCCRAPHFAPFNLGKCLQARGRHDAAAIHYEQVIFLRER